MARCRHHSGYLADDEAGHTASMARVQPPKKLLFPEMGPGSKPGYVPHPPPLDGPTGNSVLHGHQRRRPRHPQPFGNFLDFLTEGQVLDSLQTVVEEATERVAAVKTESGVPLVEVQDPIEEPSRRWARVRPSLGTVHRHRVQPSLCTGTPNNYPSCSSSASESHSSVTAGWQGFRSRDSDLGGHAFGSLPPMKDRLLLEKNLKRLLKLENKRKGFSQPCSQRNSQLWDSLGSQASSQWTLEQPLSWFSGLLGSSSGTPEASELCPTERELIFLRHEFNKEIKSLLNQPESFNLPGYCPLRQPHLTLDFLAKHGLLSTLQQVVSQAVDKLSGARRRDGRPLFPTVAEPDPGPLPDSPELPDSNMDHASDRPSNSLPTPGSSPKMAYRKNTKVKRRGKAKEGDSSVSGATQSAHVRSLKKQPLPSILDKPTASHLSNPWYEELVDYLIEQAVSLLIYKYKFERNLSKQLGFISFPVTEVLMDLYLGFKKVKGSHISLSSQIDWTCMLRKLKEAEWTRKSSQHGTSQRGTSQRSTETPSMLSEQAPETGPEEQDEATETNVTGEPESLDKQLLTSQELTEEGAEEENNSEKEPVGAVDPKLSTT
ncbi:coiled-coil domain-containing protein 116 [Dasypus novemcinctus]|uniref:coiled-coil domain-containing protein 116 n=1 Tax=Dasypus novemcinctus TaxID=9361 RepID=UPI00265D61EA|nr:coiled-coil domain-containing protein 116 [Dasypus novemcinctus]XP_058137738.1 coiled-coil domain-containing protein 116 [Dasypus novemcinctus]XP_058137740.1 coiled-coil domain-containing protein 116 [Dasypus novemcinctus]